MYLEHFKSDRRDEEMKLLLRLENLKAIYDEIVWYVPNRSWNIQQS